MSSSGDFAYFAFAMISLFIAMIFLLYKLSLNMSD